MFFPGLKFSIKEDKVKEGYVKTIILVLVFLLLFTATLITLLFFKLKTVQHNFVSGKNDLELAINLMDRGDFEAADKATKRAVNSFVFASETLSDLQNNFFIKNLALIDNNFKDFRSLAQSIEVLSSSAQRALVLINDLEPIFSGQKSSSFIDFPPEERARVLQVLYEFRPEMQGIKSNIDLSLIYLNQGFSGSLFKNFSKQMGDLRAQLQSISNSLETFIAISGILPTLSGYPEPNTYLIVFQNNNELRPSGGFIGSYGLMTLDAGDISFLETYDVYHLDMPASLNPDFNITPPEAIKKYLGVDRWFMRDSNWSPNWPTSARNIQSFYQQQMIASGQEAEILNLSGIIGITPHLITDFLYLLGEVEVDGKVYNSENFVEILQYEVEMAFREDGVSEWDRKLVIGDILNEIKSKLFSLSSESWADAYGLFIKNIEEKNLLVYLNDEYDQKISSELYWDGSIKETRLDYLMVVDANLAAFKTDRVMDKNIHYFLEEQDNGSFRSRLKLTYKNNGWFDWQTTRYRSFTRIYTPHNSRLVENSGFEGGSFVVGNEYQKSYFAGFMSIEPQQQKSFHLEYFLPEDVSKKITEQNIYTILLQKQPGNNSSFEFDLRFKRPIKEVKADGNFEISNNSDLRWLGDLSKDYYLEVVF